MRAYVECYPNQSKHYALSTFPLRNRRNFERFGEVLAVYVSEFYYTVVLQFSSVSPLLKNGYRYCMCTNGQLFL